MQTAPLIALLTDFGLADPYVGQMKSVLLAAAPGVPLVDVSHGVAAGDIAQAAFFLAATLPWLPPGAVVAAVVDPGVGTDRRVVVAEMDARLVAAPDNGLLTLALARGTGVRAFDATPRVVPASATFHGRDVFAPLAARLAMGETAAALGSVLSPEELVVLPGLTARRQGDAVQARVLSVDVFGNVATSCEAARFGGCCRQAALLSPLARPLVPAVTYADIGPGEVGILAGSQGYLELAVAGGSAAALLGLSRGGALELHLPVGTHEDY
ncbi:SAM hydrolase/SAM-dependent halogenase family protein [Solidesulfovibrio sp.]